MTQSKLTTHGAKAATARKKSFRELFAKDELAYYAVAALVYIALGVLLTDIVLNFVVGPLFFIGWMWIVPPAWQRWRSR